MSSSGPCINKTSSLILICIFTLVYSQNIVPSKSIDCKKSSGKNGTCVLYKECNSFKQLLKDGARSDLIQFIKDNNCGFINKDPMVCCDTELTVSVSNITKTEDKYPLLPGRDVCGPYYESDRIYGGSITAIDEFPWIALLGYKTGRRTSFSCGAVLISNRYVLTAGHCVVVPDTFKLTTVRLGEWNIKSERDCDDEDICNEPPLDVNIEEILLHPKFSKEKTGTIAYDLALLRLAVHVNYTEWIKPICLPTTELTKQNDFKGSVFSVSGWGLTESGVAEKKQKLKIPYFDLEQCVINFNNIGAFLHADGLICAGGEENKDTCKGDSGGPLMIPIIVNNSLNWYAVGITSFGLGVCGKKGYAGVYTKLSNYMEWINANMRP